MLFTSVRTDKAAFVYRVSRRLSQRARSTSLTLCLWLFGEGETVSIASRAVAETVLSVAATFSATDERRSNVWAVHTVSATKRAKSLSATVAAIMIAYTHSARGLIVRRTAAVIVRGIPRRACFRIANHSFAFRPVIAR